MFKLKTGTVGSLLPTARMVSESAQNWPALSLETWSSESEPVAGVVIASCGHERFFFWEEEVPALILEDDESSVYAGDVKSGYFCALEWENLPPQVEKVMSTLRMEARSLCDRFIVAV